MPIPSTPSYSTMPNNLKELLTIQRKYHRRIKTLKESLNNVTKVTRLTRSSIKKIDTNLTKFQKLLNTSKKVTDALKKGAFKEINPKLGSAINSALSLFSAGLTVMAIKNNEYIQGIELNINGIIQRDLGDAFARAVNNTLRIRDLRKQFLQFVKDYKVDKDAISARISAVESKLNNLRQLAEKAKKQANDALYEVRAGREKLEAKIESEITGIRQQFDNSLTKFVNDVAAQNAEIVKRIDDARRIGNDALYEVRVGREKLEAGINQLSNKFISQIRNIENNFQNDSNNKIKILENNFKQQVQKLFNQSNNSIKDAVRQAQDAQNQLRVLQKQISTNKLDINALKQKIPNLNVESLVRRLIANSPQTKSLLTALNAANIRIDRMDYLLPVLDRAIKAVGSKVQIVDGKVDNLQTNLSKGDPDVNRLNAQLGSLKNRVGTNETNIGINRNSIQKLDLQLKTGDLVNRQALGKLDQLLGLIPLIPARAAGLVKPNIPTLPQIESATVNGICRSTRPGGCMNKSLGNVTNNINNNVNNWGKNILDGLNAAANAAQLALLKKIDLKLGPQLPNGGISEFLKTFFKKFNKVAEWMHLDRILNILTWWQTLHNASMLSSDIVNTLAQGMDNILAFIGVKDAEGNAISIGQVVGRAYSSMLISALGQDTYNNLNKTWNAANRIYQSGANIFNAVLSIQQSILTALEAVGAGVGKLANALRAAGQVFDNAYEWMNPNPNYDNRVFAFLNRLQDTASMVETVTQTPLDIKSAVDGIKEEKNQMKEALKDAEDGLKGLGVIESESERKAQDESKAVSGGADLTTQDKLEAE